MKKLIIALIFISSLAYAEDVYKIQAHIKLASKANVVKTYLKGKKSTDIRLGKANVEVSSVKRDDKILSINLFFKSLEEARKMYDYLVSQAKDMLDIEGKDDVSKSKIELLKTTNHIPLCRRRSGDKKLSSFIKEVR